jgi:putative transposase
MLTYRRRYLTRWPRRLAFAFTNTLLLTAGWYGLRAKHPALGLIVYAARGSQYTSAACRICIAKFLALASFSWPENPYNNAQVKADWSTLKTELLPHGSAFASLQEARL